jgi:outer membrane autotransporter protein
VALGANGGTISAPGPFTLGVNSTGIFTVGANAVSGGVITLQNGTITTTSIGGQGALGVFANAASTITGTNVNVNTSGFGSAALLASGPGAHIIWTGGTVTMTNNTAIGSVAAFSGGTVDVTGTTFDVSQGVEVQSGSTVNLHGVTLNSTSFGIFASFGTDSTVLVDGGTITAVRPFGVLGSATPTTAVFNVDNAVVTSLLSSTGVVRLMDVAGGATATLNASNSMLTGSIATQPGNISNINLSDGTLWKVTQQEPSIVTNLTNSASTIQFLGPIGDPGLQSSYQPLVVKSYVGTGGTIGLNTFLKGDGSPSNKLVIDGGSATGDSALKIANTGGPGALTVANGILVVDTVNGGITVPGAFKLAGPVVAGPFEYTLFRGGMDGTAQDSWFLRSTLPTTGPSPCPLPDEPTPPGETPNFRPEVSLNAALPNLTLIYGRSIIGTMHDRVGDEVGPAAPAPAANGAWGRVIAQGGDRDGGCPVRVGPSFDYGFAAVQAGFDAIRLQDASGARDRAGVYSVFGSAHADVQSQAGADAGRDRFAAYSVGSYWTHYGAWGWYLDSLVQGTFYDVRDESTRLPALEDNGWGFAASLEAGLPFKGLLGGLGLPGGLTVEPQAQLLYQTINLGDSSDIAARVRFDDVDSLAGRLGVRFATKWAMPGFWGLSPAPGTVWFRPSYWHEFSDDARTLFSSEIGFVPFRANIAENWVELNTGLTVQVGRNTALFASGSYDIDVDGNGEAWDGKVGLKVVW